MFQYILFGGKLMNQFIINSKFLFKATFPATKSINNPSKQRLHQINN